MLSSLGELCIMSMSACGLMVVVNRNGTGNTSSNLAEAVYVWHSADTTGKGMNPIILPQEMGK